MRIKLTTMKENTIPFFKQSKKLRKIFPHINRTFMFPALTRQFHKTNYTIELEIRNAEKTLTLRFSLKLFSILIVKSNVIVEETL